SCSPAQRPRRSLPTRRSSDLVRDRETGDLRIVAVTPENEADVLVHDAHAASPTTAFALSRLADPDTLHHTPIGVLRSVDRPVYRSEEHTSELQSRENLVCRLL